MKQLLVNAALALVTGVFLILGVAGALWVGDKMFRDKKPFRSVLSYEILPTSAIVEHSMVPNVPTLTIRGTVKNNEKQRWEFVDVHVNLYVDNTQVNECTDYGDARAIEPGESALFLVSCRSISTVNLSSNLRYEVVASRKSARASHGTEP